MAVAVEGGGLGRCGAVQEFDGRVGVGQDLLGPGDQPVLDLRRAEVGGGVGIGGQGGAALCGRQAYDLLQVLVVWGLNFEASGLPFPMA